MTRPRNDTDQVTDRLSLLQAIGVRVWFARAAQTDGSVTATEHIGKARRPLTQDPKQGPTPGVRRGATTGAAVSAMNWEALSAAVSGCRACDLHRGRSQTVFGTGDQSARWMIVGEAPGAEEDRQGEPFVGRAGQLLNAMLLAAGFRRHEVYIANIVKCRPPDNRDPRPDEAAACSAYLNRQIELVKPQLILAVGRVAAQRLLDSDTPVGKLRGKLHHYGEGPGGVPVVVTYHPAYLLRSPKEKRKVWQDLLFALDQSTAS